MHLLAMVPDKVCAHAPSNQSQSLKLVTQELQCRFSLADVQLVCQKVQLIWTVTRQTTCIRLVSCLHLLLLASMQTANEPNLPKQRRINQHETALSSPAGLACLSMALCLQRRVCSGQGTHLSCMATFLFVRLVSLDKHHSMASALFTPSPSRASQWPDLCK